MLKVRHPALRQAVRVCASSILLGSTSLIIAGAAHAQSAPQAGATASEDPSYDIVVTARRRAENIQTVPVAVTAVSGEELQQRAIVTTQDLQKMVPGVVFGGAGGSESPVFTIRGQGRDQIGAALPSVITYLDEVPLPARGSVIPTFDVANVQVLKGPQGTLFGRNTTGGAVLYYSQKPTFDFGGYAQGTLGDYSWHAFEGAINVPLIADKLAIRVAGQYQKRNGYVQNMSGAGDPDNINSRAFRISVLAQPVEGVKNTLVYDYYLSRTNNNGVIVLGPTAGSFATFLGFLQFSGLAPLVPTLTAAFNCTTSIDCNIDQQIARQKAAGPRKVWSRPGEVPFSRVFNWGITNTTEIDLGGVAVKNIFAYRISRQNTDSNSDGMSVDLLTGGPRYDTKQVSDELQISGKAFGDKLNYLLGAFYMKASPAGPQVLPLQLFRPAFVPADAWPLDSNSNTLITDESKALFANLTYEIVPGLRFNAGFRHTWDTEGVCGYNGPYTAAGQAADLADCRAKVSVGNVGAPIDLSTKFEANTWNLGLDYQATRDLFVYGVARRGYRAGQFNTPKLGGILVPYQTYAPQYVTDFEVGVKADWRAGEFRGRTNIALFHSNFTNLQRQISSLVPNFDGDNNPANDPNGTSIVVNSGKSRVQGFEVSGFVSPVPALTIDYGLAYTDAKVTDLGVPAIFAGAAGGAGEFDQTPKWSYSFAGRYQLPFKLAGGDITLRASYYWIDDYVVGALKFPSHYTIDAGVDINHIANSGLNLTFFVNNLTNQTYLGNSVLSGLGLGVFAADYAPPRMFGVRARYDF